MVLLNNSGNKFVPYTGATKDVDLGSYSLTAIKLIAPELCFDSNACFKWDTTDANANFLKLDIPQVGSNVPIFSLGIGTIGQDLALFDGLTEPEFVVWKADRSSYIMMGYDPAKVAFGLQTPANMYLSLNPGANASLLLGESLVICPDGSGPGNSSWGVFCWPYGSMLYEQRGGGDPDRFFYLANGDRWECLNEAGNEFLLGVHGANSAVADRVISYHGLVVGSSYAASAPPTQGLIVVGNAGIHESAPETEFQVTASANNTFLTYKGKADYGSNIWKNSAGTVMGYVGYSKASGYINNSLNNGIHIRGTNGVTIGYGSSPRATFESDKIKFWNDVVIGRGLAAIDYTLTFDGETNDGVITWMEDEDYFAFSDDVLNNTSEKHYFRDTAIGIYSQADTFLDLFADGSVRIGDSSAGAPTNYVEIESDADVNFVADAGLQFGEIYAYEVGTTITIVASGIANKVQVTAFNTDGESNGSVTPDHTNDHITVGKAGRYLVTISMSVESTGGSSYVLSAGLWKNNGATQYQNIHMSISLSGAGSDYNSTSMSGIVDVAANDTLELWAWNETNTNNFVIDDVTMSVVQIGGTT